MTTKLRSGTLRAFSRRLIEVTNLMIERKRARMAKDRKGDLMAHDEQNRQRQVRRGGQAEYSWRVSTASLLFVGLLWWGGAVSGQEKPLGLPEKRVPCSACFPVDALSLEERSLAEVLLLKALDGEALYTMIGDLKPMSSGFASFRVSASEPTSEELANLETQRRLLAAWTCGETFYAGLHHFATVHEGRRYVDAVLVNRPLLRKVLDERRGFFGGFGLTASAHPLEVLFAVEYSAQPARLRHYGHLFGYPDHAVDFFVAAAASQASDGKFVERDFLRVPTYRMIEGRSPFVYAVPKGHSPNQADRAIAERAAVILDAYRQRREAWVGEGRPGIFAMLRDWFDDGKGHCSPAQARLDQRSKQ